jgi:altronate dehydratase large subunit
MQFRGYKRPDGLVGIRNHVLILPTVGCANETCRIVSGIVNGTVSLCNQNGCGEVEGNLRLTQTVLSGLAANPNVFATILVGLGCELNSVDEMAGLIQSKTNKPLHKLVIQEEGGTINTVCRAAQIAQKLVIEASRCIAEQVPISEIMLGIECGGSDATSGLASNPVLGQVSDWIVELGGTAMFSETPEIIGAEHILARRCRDPETGKRILDICDALEFNLSLLNQSLRSGQPSPGNMAGGISTLEEKSLGCIHKGGTQPLAEVVEYGQKPGQKGLVFMDTPGYDLLSVSAKVAAGCQMIVFTTGRGNPMGNPVAPVLKVTANQETFRKMIDNMDMDLSPVLRGEQTIQEMGKQVLSEIIDVACGKKTKAEVHGFGFSEVVMRRACDYV